MRKRVYHPVTNEPFDTVVSKANRLVLEEGWLQQPIDPTAVAAVQASPRGRGIRARRQAEEFIPQANEWPESEGTDQESNEA